MISIGPRLGNVWDTSGRRLGDDWETTGRRLGDVWETSVYVMTTHEIFVYYALAILSTNEQSCSALGENITSV